MNKPLSLFVSRLLLRSELTGFEQQAILSLEHTIERIRGRSDFARTGQIVDHVTLMSEGLAARYDLTKDGSRHIGQMFVPGDVCDLQALIAPRAGSGLLALGDITVCKIPHKSLRDLIRRHPAIAIAFWRDTTADAAILSKWVVNLGRKDALARVAHLICELGVRMEAAGLGTRSCFAFPATQEQIGDATGLTAVHVNRMCKELRGAGLVDFQKGTAKVLNWKALAAVAQFEELSVLPNQPENFRNID